MVHSFRSGRAFGTPTAKPTNEMPSRRVDNGDFVIQFRIPAQSMVPFIPIRARLHALTAKPTNETPSRRVDFIGELQLRIPNSELKLEFLDLLKRQAGVLGN